MTSQPVLKRTVNRIPAILLVVSAIIGSGVFKKIAPMADSLYSPQLILICWAAAGMLSLMGALCNAELASMMASSGGEFVYFKRIYGRFFSFLYGWGNFTVMRSCAIAALAQIFAESLHALFPLSYGGIGIKLVATALVVGLSYVNHRGIVFGEKISRYLIVGIVIAILSFVATAALSGKGSVELLTSSSSRTPEDWYLFVAFFGASLSAFWGYEGWNNIGYIGEEVRNPQKNIPIALGVGTLIVITLYLLMNTAYLYIMPVEQLAAIHHAENKIAAVEVARVMSGNIGAVLLSSLILLTTFNCVNSTILTSSRVFFAMARDGLFLPSAGKIHPVHHTPSKAIMWQCMWALVLLWWGNFDQLTDLLIFAAFMFYGATAIGVIILRKKEPDAPRPYKVIGYPVLPAVFALFCLVLVVVTIFRQPANSLLGMALIFSGAPIYFYYVRKNKKSDGSSAL